MVHLPHLLIKQSSGITPESLQILKGLCNLQASGFASDSVRMINTVRSQAPHLQVLLFSATFNDSVKQFALRIAGNDSNQASLYCCLLVSPESMD